MQQIGTVGKPDWDARPCYIVGGGPSLKPYAEKLWLLYQRGWVIAVNDSYKNCYFPDVIFSLDHLWLENNLPKFRDMPGPAFVAVGEDNPRVERPNLTYLHRQYRPSGDPVNLLSEDPSVIWNGMNSGFGALNFAFLKGAKTIYLLGFDFKEIQDKTHFHAGYAWHNRIGSNLMFPKWARAFEDTVPQLKAAGVEVFNCSDNSLLCCFPHKPYSEVL